MLIGQRHRSSLNSINEQLLEPGMLIALEPTFQPNHERRYHLEDLVLMKEAGCEVLTDWESTAEMIRIGT